MAVITYWGKLADVTGRASETYALPEQVQDTSALRAWIDTQTGGDGVFLAPENRIAINDEIVTEPCAVTDGDDIAFLPPVGGG